MRNASKHLAAGFTYLAIAMLLSAALAIPTQNALADAPSDWPPAPGCDLNGGTAYCKENYKDETDCNTTHHSCDDQTGCNCQWVPTAGWCACQRQP